MAAVRPAVNPSPAPRAEFLRKTRYDACNDPLTVGTRLQHRLFAFSFLALGGGALLIPDALALYTIPKGTDKETVKRVLTEELPKQYNEDPPKPNCGYRKNIEERASMTKVEGLPLKDQKWPMSIVDGRTPDKQKEYPQSAKGLLFATYKDNPTCKAIRDNNPDVPCRQSKDDDKCQEFCEKVNQRDYQYCVDRISECSVTKAVFGPDPNSEDDPPPIIFLYCVTGNISTADGGFIPSGDDTLPDIFVPPSDDCNTCAPSDGICNTESEPTNWARAGWKYQCTGNFGEQSDKTPIGDDCGKLKVDYGWVWGGGGPAWEDMPDRCQARWNKEKLEHRNCREGGCDGEYCRTDEEHLVDDPTKIPPNDPNKVDPLKPGPEQFDPLNGSRYESFYRHYWATHTLADIPQTKYDEDYTVELSCYDWYKENVDLKKSENLNCVADDLQLKKMEARRVWEGDPKDLRLSPENDTAPATDEGKGGYALDYLHKNASDFITPALQETPEHPPITETGAHMPFGETPKYMQVLQDLERDMEGIPPTVQLILPIVHAKDEVGQQYTSTGASTSSEAVSITDLRVPLQPGLVEEVQALLHRSLLSRIEEVPVPVVVPLLSQSEVQLAIEKWESWRDIRKYGELGSTQNADEIIQKLKGYSTQIEEYGKMRAEYLKMLSSALEDRKKLTDAIDAWVASKMDPYTQAMEDRSQLQRLVDSWKRLKDSATSLTLTNTPYCKNDTTTPPLEWIESDKAFPPPPLRKKLEEGNGLAPLPKHYIFDFSDVFFEGIENLKPLQIPVLMPVQVSIILPTPMPDSDENGIAPPTDSLPILPPVPKLDPLNNDTEVVPPEGSASVSLPSYDDVIEAFLERAADLDALAQRYSTYLWVKEQHPKFDCPAFGANGCVFPETRLWDVFMRIWAPLGVFTNREEDPKRSHDGSKAYLVPWGATFPTPHLPECEEDDDICLLEEKRVKEGLKVTFPEKDESPLPIDEIRRKMRETTITNSGSLEVEAGKAYRPNAPLFYPTYITPKPLPLDYRNSSSSK